MSQDNPIMGILHCITLVTFYTELMNVNILSILSETAAIFITYFLTNSFNGVVGM